MNKIKFIDLFAGIGGFHLALHNEGAECVFASELNIYSRKTYEHNFNKISHIFPDNFNKDIKTINIKELPNFDILCAGFPCQPFSNAGKKLGFNDDRGNHFFTIASIIKEKQPQAFILENVRNLEKHDNGKTFKTIQKIITEDLGYSFYYQLIKATDFNLPQHRPRIYMVGFKNKDIQFKFPESIPLTTNMSEIFNGECDKKIGYTLRVGGRRSAIGDRHNWDGYIVNGKEVRLTPETGKKMQGFPESFIFPISDNQAMKQLGNSVAVPVVQEIYKKIKEYLE